jgi:RNA polymerase sigma factor (sigma-70 family)
MLPDRVGNSKHTHDEILIEALRDGQLQSVIQLYTLGRARIIRHVIRNNGNIDEAEDIVQDAVILVYEKICREEFILEGNLSSYIFTIGKNLWFKELRKKTNISSLSEQAEFIDIISTDDLSEERYQMLSESILNLSEKCQEILKKRYWTKMKFADLAIDWGETIASLKMKSSRCHQELRNLLLNHDKP